MKVLKATQTPGLYTNIRSICEEKCLTISELERATGLGNGVVRKWNVASPTLRTVIAVADFLGVTLDELVRPHKTENGKENSTTGKARTTLSQQRKR